MPKWSNCWHFLSIADSPVDWYVDQVFTRVHHVGVIESEEADIFLIAAQQVLLQLLDPKEEIFFDLGRSQEECATIREGLLSGLQQMIVASEHEEVVFWTSGYDADHKKLVDTLQRFRLGDQHSEYVPPPHRLHRQQETLLHLNSQRKEMRRRLATIGPDKNLKRFIHELKDRA